MLIPAPAPAPALSSLHFLSSHYPVLPSHFLPPGDGPRPLRRGDLAIRMGGGPRTFPGGVSKWQWKRMQAKKAHQLLKARLARERQLYEMGKRAELRDAVAHLERPWDPAAAVVQAAPNLLSVAADDQLRALSDRFHRPGGIDLWNDSDGPHVFASPATGAASARFFPKNAVHSVQPYALRDAGGDAVDLLLGRGDGGARSVRDNAPEDEACSEPADELMERDGTWEPVHALDDGDDSIHGHWSSDDDDDDVATSESEGIGDVTPGRVPRAMMIRQNGRSNSVARWEAASAMAPCSHDDRGWSGDASSSDSGGAREPGHREQRWQERNSSASSRKRAGGRWNASNTAASSRVNQRSQTGAGSFSDSEVIHGGPEPKWRTRNRDGARIGAGMWNAPRKDWNGNEFNSNSDSERSSRLEPRWGARDRLNGRENFRGRLKPKHNADTIDGDVPGRYARSNNGDEHASRNNGDERFRIGGAFAEDLEAPTWKPRRTNRARNNNGGRDDGTSAGSRRGYNGTTGAGFRNGDTLPGNPRYTSRDDGRQMSRNGGYTSRDDGRQMSRDGGRRFRGDQYSLRPTSELHSSWREAAPDEL